ncbi:adenylate cyclase type 6-like isoform 1, partial [Dinothrombium tinctorium]
HLTRLHSIRSQSESSIFSDTISSNLSHKYDKIDKSWSLKHLKNEFVSKDSERLFSKYQIRLQHNFFMVSLMLNIGFNLVAITMYFLDKPPDVFPGPAIIRISSLIVFISFFILTCLDELWLRPKSSRIIAAVTVLIAMISAEYGDMLFVLAGDTKSFSMGKIRPTFYMILINHVFLPFPSKIYACISTAWIIVLELLITTLSRFQLYCDCSLNEAIRFTVADAVFHLMSGCIGFFLMYALEIANRKAFLDHRSCVESKIKLDHETEQQNQLLGSCIPKHLTERVREDIRTIIQTVNTDQKIPHRPFNELYVEKYKNVTILYADIVNSMILAAKLDANDLVETLNELFGRFDESAERNNCLRIKLLGDCYYCVSGVPYHDQNHALNCVRMGLEMIRIICTVREARDLNVDMRIGVHSGMVLSGLIGLQKWQYDIWSIDCMIASLMEHQGVPGRVHCTKTTLDLIPKNCLQEFDIEERRNENDEITFLISTSKNKTITEESMSPVSRRKGQTDKLTAHISKLRRRSSYHSITLNAEQAELLESLQKYREMVKSVNQRLEENIDEMPIGKKVQWFHPQGINPLFLTFMSTENASLWKLEKQFAVQRDPLYKYYLYCSFIILLHLLSDIGVDNHQSLHSCQSLAEIFIQHNLSGRLHNVIALELFHFGHLYYMLTVVLLLHVFDRQVEYILRLGFQWTVRLEKETKKAMAMGEINQILLENILPIHVAERYLYSSSAKCGKLYHESYDSIAVMFASIPNYVNFYTETSINDEGLKCLQLLNEIICDFDKLLSHPSFPRIEKIKTIGSTYMAAAGLQPGRGSTDSEVSFEDVTLNVVQLVRFATALMETLQRINKDALQEFKLRVGIAVGPVIAGVVGAAKPQYDIWGDTVNMASRMDSTGIPGRIHVTELVKDILVNCEAYKVECRGLTMVKGKGHMITYLVVTQFDFE